MSEERKMGGTSEAGNTLLFLAVVVAFALLSFGAYSLLKKDTAKETDTPAVAEQPVVPVETRDIEVTTPTANATSTFPLTVSGTVYGNGWSAFEGQVGTLSLLDESGKVLLEQTAVPATSEWTKLPVSFSITIGDAKLAKTLNGKKITIRLSAENPKGEGETKSKDIQITVSQ